MFEILETAELDMIASLYRGSCATASRSSEFQRKGEQAERAADEVYAEHGLRYTFAQSEISGSDVRYATSYNVHSPSIISSAAHCPYQVDTLRDVFSLSQLVDRGCLLSCWRSHQSPRTPGEIICCSPA